MPRRFGDVIPVIGFPGPAPPETFVIDHANAASWRQQDSILTLESANAQAYQAGYQAAYAGYEDLSKRHIAEPKKPRVRLGSTLGLLGATGIGVLIGSATR